VPQPTTLPRAPNLPLQANNLVSCRIYNFVAHLIKTDCHYLKEAWVENMIIIFADEENGPSSLVRLRHDIIRSEVT
jgi:hypothetical protein